MSGFSETCLLQIWEWFVIWTVSPVTTSYLFEQNKWVKRQTTDQNVWKDILSKTGSSTLYFMNKCNDDYKAKRKSSSNRIRTYSRKEKRCGVHLAKVRVKSLLLWCVRSNAFCWMDTISPSLRSDLAHMFFRSVLIFKVSFSNQGHKKSWWWVKVKMIVCIWLHLQWFGFYMFLS